MRNSAMIPGLAAYLVVASFSLQLSLADCKADISGDLATRLGSMENEDRISFQFSLMEAFIKDTTATKVESEDALDSLNRANWKKWSEDILGKYDIRQSDDTAIRAQPPDYSTKTLNNLFASKSVIAELAEECSIATLDYFRFEHPVPIGYGAKIRYLDRTKNPGLFPFFSNQRDALGRGKR